jgi:hypothetical protein
VVDQSASFARHLRRVGHHTIFGKSLTYQVAAIIQAAVALRAVSVEHFPPFHHVAVAAVFLDQLVDVIAALAVALGAFDAGLLEFY